MPVQELGVADPGPGGIGAGQREHVGAGVQAVGGARGADSPGGEQDVESAAGAEVQDGLARLEAGDRYGLPQPRLTRSAASGTSPAPG